MAFAGFVFDAYGTLFDVHSAVRRHAEGLGPRGERLSETWRNKQLEYAWVRSLMGSYADFWTLTTEALDFAMAESGLDDAALRDALLEAYWTLDAYDDVRDALVRQREKGAKTAILTNGSTDMIQAAVEHAGLADLLDDIFCVDAVKVFKTSPDVYRMVPDSWDLVAGEISFQSSNRWDIAGAAKFGFESVWINRANRPDEYRKYAPSRTITTLADL